MKKHQSKNKTPTGKNASGVKDEAASTSASGAKNSTSSSSQRWTGGSK